MIAKQPVHSMFKLAALPHTTLATAEQHSCRAYHQEQQWLNEQKDPLKWCWKMIGGHLRPITTTYPIAPEDLLSVIVCTCKDECVQNCKCRRSGLNSSSMCSNCSERDASTEIC
ncbi:hypothetical protein AVEN_205925-1 [Araneus ventricosus]|uniref:Tesmin/TSO1-like CXC domain-containing protein n=1 Tax=Araneus ventricosus TaxID=182803 RepID=A0A4Y2HHF6_ARAVE|nr:hypothetical protein AVEN_205925-1 [Araneus ventricosus]